MNKGRRYAVLIGSSSFDKEPNGLAPKGEYLGETIEVGSLNIANAFGLSDMHGNVWEWCEDDHMGINDNYIGAPGDGSARLKRRGLNLRVMRGGSFRYPAATCRSAERGARLPNGESDDLGFRVVFGARTN